jgi:hypothetical protein
VTATEYSPSALVGICQNAADAVGLGGTWVEWLSVSIPPARKAFDAVPGNGPWSLLNGQVAFKNHAQLATQPLLPINVTETGTVLTSGYAWTGTASGGGPSGDDCSGWNSASPGDATYGNVASTASWTQYSLGGCSITYHVYCFEK